jgi:exopolysaccharide production protein ExoY
LASIPVPRQAAPVNELTWQVVDVCERAASLALLAALAPLIVGIAAAVWALSGRSPLIAHRRVGWQGATLWMLKFRTMWPQAAERGANARQWVELIVDTAGPEGKQDGDPRVTNSFARFCRRHSLDEIPQLWHVLRGEMALVGPRPITDAEMRRYYGNCADEVLQVKPGIAGLWQTSGRSGLSYGERRALDLRFVRQRSLRMYGDIVLRTFREVWNGSNAW